jgi:integrase
MQEIVVIEASHSLTRAGKVANQAAARIAFDEYRANRPAQSRRAQRTDLANFAQFLGVVGIGDAPDGDALQSEPAAWQGITHGLVLAYREWLMARGYAIATVNRRLATVKVYAQLALAGAAEVGSESTQNGVHRETHSETHSEIEKIKAVRGFGHKHGRNRDAQRKEKGTPTRIGAKKAYKVVTLNAAQAKRLKTHPPTPQGRRDALLMSLLLDHGLRCGEVAALDISAFDLNSGTMTFYRPKVDKRQTHRLSSDTLLALAAWIESGDAPTEGRILRGSRKGGSLTHAGMSERAITGRVRELGQSIGIPKLSAHDCRHYWATRATQLGTHPRALQQAGGWNSPAMVMRYVDESEIANDGVII